MQQDIRKQAVFDFLTQEVAGLKACIEEGYYLNTSLEHTPSSEEEKTIARTVLPYMENLLTNFENLYFPWEQKS